MRKAWVRLQLKAGAREVSAQFEGDYLVDRIRVVCEDAPLETWARVLNTGSLAIQIDGKDLFVAVLNTIPCSADFSLGLKTPLIVGQATATLTVPVRAKETSTWRVELIERGAA